MTKLEFEDLLKGLHTKHFTINSRIGLIEGKICVSSENRIYLCQNRISGSCAPNLLGYNNSWRIEAVYDEIEKSVFVNMFDNEYCYFDNDGTDYSTTLRIDGLDIYSAVTRKLTLYDLL